MATYTLEELLHDLENGKYRGIKRLAASNLCETQEGLELLRRIYKEKPDVVREAYKILSDECLHKLIHEGTYRIPNDVHPKEELYGLAEDCPICGATPDKLIWVLGDSYRDCGEGFFKSDTFYYIVCEKCGLQLEKIRPDSTPPGIEINLDELDA